MRNYKSEIWWDIFENTVIDYHKFDDVDAEKTNPFEKNGQLENLLYDKCWIDCVQWHLEDIIRNPEIDPVEALKIKRRIDASNQERTNLVEKIDEYFYEVYKSIPLRSEAQINTETLAWAIDRLSILSLKIYHMKAETERSDASQDHFTKCKEKLDILQLQKSDLCLSINQLINDISRGNKIIRLYKQMKMYNDPSLNPVLYKTHKQGE
jgi:hypothetical protein